MTSQNYTIQSHSKNTNNISANIQNVDTNYILDPMCLSNNSVKSIKWFPNKAKLLEQVATDGTDDVFLSRDVLPNSGVKQFAQSNWDTYVALLQSNNHIYEIIDKDTHRYSYLDLDYSDLAHFHAYIQTNEYIASRNYLITEVKQALQDWHESNREPFDINKLVILDSSYEKKVSLHIVNRNILFKNSEDCKIWHEHFKDFIDNESVRNRKYDILTIPKCLDMAPYSSFQNFRSVNQSKMINDPLKKPVTLKIISEHEIRDSIVTFISEGDKPCEISPEWYPEIEDVIEFIMPENIDISDVLNIFINLTPALLEDRETWMKIVWAGKNLGLSDEEILLISNKAQNHDEEATLKLIREHNPANSTIGIGTIFFYLKDVIDTKLYRKLTEPFRNKQFVKQQIKLLTCTDIYKPIIRTDKYVYSQIFDENTKRCTVIHAGLGKGKTQGTVDHINSHKYDSIIVVSPRVSFAKSVKGRLDDETEYEFELYNKSRKNYIITAPYIVIQTESLHRLDLNVYTNWGNNTLLIVDEVESIASQMSVGKTHALNHMKNLQTFEQLFKQCSKIIALDAFISPKTVNLLQDLQIEFNLYRYTVPLVKRVCRSTKTIEAFIHKLAEDIIAGKRIYGQFSSNKKLTELIIPKVTAICLQAGKIIKVCEHHSKRNTVKLVDIKQEWPKYDLVACTSTITVGVNYDTVGVFDALYCFASSSSKNLTRDLFQGLYRVRHVNDNMLTYFLDPRLIGVNMLSSKKLIKMDMKYTNQLKNQQATHHLDEQYEKTPQWVNNLIIANRYEQSMSCINLESMFQHYLEACFYSEQGNDDEDVEYSHTEDVVVKCELNYFDIPEIDLQEMKLLKKKKIDGDDLTDLEQASITKFWMLSCLLPIHDDHQRDKDYEFCWRHFIDYGYSKFKNIGYEKGVVDGSIRIRDLLENTKFSGIVDNLSLQLESMRDICHELGLKSSYELRQQVSKEQLEKATPWFIENYKKLHTTFGMKIRKDTSKTPPVPSRIATSLIGKIFTKWGYSKFKKCEKREKGPRDKEGKREDTTPFEIISQIPTCAIIDGVFILEHHQIGDFIKAKSQKKYDRLVITSSKIRADIELTEK